MRNRKPFLLLSFALPWFAACGSSSSVGSNAIEAGPPIVYPGPVVENVPGLDIPFVAGTTFPLADVGYEGTDFFFPATRICTSNVPRHPATATWRDAPPHAGTKNTHRWFYPPSIPPRSKARSFSDG